MGQVEKYINYNMYLQVAENPIYFECARSASYLSC